MPRHVDEHMNLPTWRVRQLQDIEDAARAAREEIVTTPWESRADAALVARIKDLLDDVLDER